jgi:hypothetical protein
MIVASVGEQCDDLVPIPHQRNGFRDTAWGILNCVTVWVLVVVSAYNRRIPEAKMEIPAGALGALKTAGHLGKKEDFLR